jgi:hypothetical protein
MKIRCVPTNSSVLVYSETVLPRLNKRKYAFQWMRPNGALLMRCDNAPHHPNIATFPHHRHVGSEDAIEESPEMTLESVLAVISNTVVGSSLLS